MNSHEENSSLLNCIRYLIGEGYPKLQRIILVKELQAQTSHETVPEQVEKSLLHVSSLVKALLEHFVKDTNHQVQVATDPSNRTTAGLDQLKEELTNMLPLLFFQKNQNFARASLVEELYWAVREFDICKLASMSASLSLRNRSSPYF
eukprot:TRINITY_DN0_c0_g7_i1.p1 TRINITY_DN0_c0_g7~~TRINITY_DN0_c0_g7_i1.p1  ORF type:complete len:148 (+),score=21.20 TRINITY_DN0_c0_g7_i1:343-786(+)